MKILRRLFVGLFLLLTVIVVVLTFRACANSVSENSNEFEQSIREIVDAEDSIKNAFEKNGIDSIHYTGREPGRYSNGIAFFDLKDSSDQELLIYWSLNRATAVYSVDRIVVRNGFDSKIIWAKDDS